MMHRHRMMISTALLAIGLCVGALAPARAPAAPVTFQATHLVSASSVQSVDVGDRLVTTFTFDTTVTDLDQDPRRGHYAITGSAPVLSVRAITDDDLGIALIESLAYIIDILDEFQQQIADEAFLDTGAGTSRLQWLLDFEPTTFSSDHLPVSPPDLSAYLGDAAFYQLVTDSGTITGGDLLSLVAVPEPPSWLLVAASVLASGLLLRRLRPPMTAAATFPGTPTRGHRDGLPDQSHPPEGPRSAQDG